MMDLLTVKIIAIAGLGIISLIFGLIPIKMRRCLFKGGHNAGGKRQVVLSFLLCFGAGVLFAAVMIHMMPEIREGFDRVRMLQSSQSDHHSDVPETSAVSGELAIAKITAAGNSHVHNDHEEEPMHQDDAKMRKQKVLEHAHNHKTDHHHEHNHNHDHAHDTGHSHDHATNDDHGTEDNHEHAAEANHIHDAEGNYMHGSEGNHMHGSEGNHTHGSVDNHTHEAEGRHMHGSEDNHMHNHSSNSDDVNNNGSNMTDKESSSGKSIDSSTNDKEMPHNHAIDEGHHDSMLENDTPKMIDSEKLAEEEMTSDNLPIAISSDAKNTENENGHTIVKRSVESGNEGVATTTDESIVPSETTTTAAPIDDAELFTTDASTSEISNGDDTPATHNESSSTASNAEEKVDLLDHIMDHSNHGQVDHTDKPVHTHEDKHPSNTATTEHLEPTDSPINIHKADLLKIAEDTESPEHSTHPTIADQVDHTENTNSIIHGLPNSLTDHSSPLDNIDRMDHSDNTSLIENSHHADHEERDHSHHADHEEHSHNNPHATDIEHSNHNTDDHSHHTHDANHEEHSHNNDHEEHNHSGHEVHNHSDHEDHNHSDHVDHASATENLIHSDIAEHAEQAQRSGKSAILNQPSRSDVAEHADHDHSDHAGHSDHIGEEPHSDESHSDENGHPYPLTELIICAGVFLVYFIEELVGKVVGGHSAHGSHGHSHIPIPNHNSHSHKNGKIHSDSGYRKKFGSRGAWTPARMDGIENPAFSEDSDTTSCNSGSRIEQSFEDQPRRYSSNPSSVTTEVTERPDCRQILMSNIRSVLMVLALSFHSTFEGLAIGLQENATDVWYLTLAVAAHKLVIHFSVSLELLTIGVSTLSVLLYTFVMALTNPIGGSLGMFLTADIAHFSDPTQLLIITVLQALSAGTILYVVFFEIMERERGKEGHRMTKFFAFLLGFAFLAIIENFGGHSHGPSEAGHNH